MTQLLRASSNWRARLAAGRSEATSATDRPEADRQDSTCNAAHQNSAEYCGDGRPGHRRQNQEQLTDIGVAGIRYDDQWFLKSVLEFLRTTDSEWVSQWLIDKILEGAPFG